MPRIWTGIRRLLDHLDSFRALAQLLGPTTVPAAVMGYLAYITEWLGAWGPIAWGAAGLVGMLCGALCLALFGWFRGQLAYANYTQAIAEQPKTVNPLAQHFAEMRIKLADLIIPSREGIYVHAGKTFTNCIFIGPGSVAFAGCALGNIQRAGCNVSIFNNEIQFLPDVLFRGCTIVNCAFFDITIFLHEHDVEEGQTAQLFPREEWTFVPREERAAEAPGAS